MLPAAPMGKPLPGNAAKLAAWIQEAVGGDLHSIVVKESQAAVQDWLAGLNLKF